VLCFIVQIFIPLSLSLSITFTDLTADELIDTKMYNNNNNNNNVTVLLKSMSVRFHEIAISFNNKVDHLNRVEMLFLLVCLNKLRGGGRNNVK